MICFSNLHLKIRSLESGYTPGFNYNLLIIHHCTYFLFMEKKMADWEIDIHGKNYVGERCAVYHFSLFRNYFPYGKLKKIKPIFFIYRFQYVDSRRFLSVCPLNNCAAVLNVMQFKLRFAHCKNVIYQN